MGIPEKYLKQAEFVSVLLIFLGTPISKGLMSVGLGCVGGLILLRWASNKFRIPDIKPSIIWWCLLFPVIELLALSYTADFKSGWKLVTLHLPLYVFPLWMFYRKEGWTLPEKRWFFGGFIFTTLLNVLITYWIGAGYAGTDIADVRDASIFISHMRLGMMCVLSVALLWHINWSDNPTAIGWFKTVLILIITAFLIWSKSLTALITLSLLTGFQIWHWMRASNRSRQWTLASILAVVGFCIWAVVTVRAEYSAFHTPKMPIGVTFESKTPDGGHYTHDTTTTLLENGYQTTHFFCRREMKNAWNEKSTIAFDSVGGNHFVVANTLVRFLTSKGVPKDGHQVRLLTAEEVSAIENGCANVRFLDGVDLRDRIYETIWEFDRYQKGRNPSGNSLTQRIALWKGALVAAAENPIVGHGTGNVQPVLHSAYEELGELKPRFWLKTHNQWLTFVIQFGWLGTLLILVGWGIPFMQTQKSTLTWQFGVVILLAMFMEDLLDSQAGVTLFALFFGTLIAQPLAHHQK